MSRGGSVVSATGNVGDPITFGKTPSGDDCCSFMLAIDERGTDNPVWVKINMYGAVVRLCEERLRKGCSLTVHGSFMNRKRNSGESAVEVRGREVMFHLSPVKKDENG